MKHSKSYERDWALFEGANKRQINSCDDIKRTIQNKIDDGHQIVWAPNERWCEIDGETFNIGKALFETWVSNNELILPFNYTS